MGMTTLNPSVSDALRAVILKSTAEAGGWLPFDAFMHAALYAPGLGYYANPSQKFGLMPQSGSDFVTAPELSPVFGACVGAQVAQALQASGTRCVYEFGAGTGAMALQICEQLVPLKNGLERYFIIEVSSSLRQRQQELLARFGDRVQWLDALPEQMQGVVIGNEVLDAMPVKLLARRGGIWHERGVAMEGESFCWRDQATPLRPSIEIDGPHDYLTEIHPQAEGFMRTLADHLQHGAAFFIDYGFPEHEYYHPQRHMGTVMCHRAHLADANPLVDAGEKDITAHVNFTGIALAAQEAGFDVLGYCTQARFLMNCGLLELLENASFQDKAMAQKLISEHEMGELFKVIGLEKRANPEDAADRWQAIGFSAGDRTHTL